MPRHAPRVMLTPRVREALERITRSRTAEQRHVERARIVVMSADGWRNVAQAEVLGVDAQRVDRWRRRWAAEADGLAAAEAEGATDDELTARLHSLLDDAPRSGTPPTFSPEQVAQLISLACEPPGDSGRPISRWTPNELAMEAVKRGIVASISPRHLDRLMKRGRSTPA